VFMFVRGEEEEKGERVYIQGRTSTTKAHEGKTGSANKSRLFGRNKLEIRRCRISRGDTTWV
jgi:hypothetical protein